MRMGGGSSVGARTRRPASLRLRNLRNDKSARIPPKASVQLGREPEAFVGTILSDHVVDCPGAPTCRTQTHRAGECALSGATHRLGQPNPVRPERTGLRPPSARDLIGTFIGFGKDDDDLVPVVLQLDVPPLTRHYVINKDQPPLIVVDHDKRRAYWFSHRC
jgi:hypothetical protein